MISDRQKILLMKDQQQYNSPTVGVIWKDYGKKSRSETPFTRAGSVWSSYQFEKSQDEHDS